MIEQLKIDFNKIEENSKFSEDNIKFRKKNLQHFVEKGFPNKRIEDWKFSDLNQIISSNIGNLSFFNDKEFKNSEQIYLIDKFEHNKIIFINGVISKIDIKHEDDKKIIINNDLNFIGNSNEVNPLVSLNNALANTYTCVTVKENYSLNKPLIIYNITTEELQSTALNLRIDIKLERNSNLKLVTIFDDNSQQNFININQNFDIAQDAILKSYKIDHKANSNIKYFYNNINLAKNSISENFIFSTGSKFIKNEVNCNLNDQYSSAFINGVINLNNFQHHEIKTNINHLAENTKSYQLIKTVLNDKSKGVYQGKIYVDAKAQKTNGYQLSKALLLNKDTEFDGKPELEIYADDVKCSHGSTSGNLDEDSIFYLMSRGLSHLQSKELLINGFLMDAVEKITDLEIKDLIKDIMGIKE
ncbi:MAG: SufD family Fe-S cluster assembly protein [Candidatus Pelagibacter sp.]|nr:SufD family Fe-S cluster assembly protein [Candidatus Pelagibacter sp.]